MEMHGFTDVLSTRDTIEGWLFGAAILGVTALVFSIL